MPAGAVIPATIAYIKVVVVKKLVVGSRQSEGRGVWALRWKRVGLPVGLAPGESHCFAGPGNRCLVQTSIND